METTGQNTFSTTSVIGVAVALTGCDTNENFGQKEGSENKVLTISNSVSLYESYHDFK